MINIGCDIGKSHFDVFWGGKFYKFKNEKDGIRAFIEKCRKAEISRIILESTGGYERNLLRELEAKKLPVSVVNPYYVRNFAKSKKDLAKTDKIDAQVLAEYGEKMEPRIHEPKEAYRLELEGLTEHRDCLVEMMREEKQRLEKNPDKIVERSLNQHLKY
jgi:transposase